MLFTLRILLPDRPGTLGSVASAFGQGGANILTLDVVGSEDGLAVDDMLVEAPQGMQQALRLAAQTVPGLVVEQLRPLEAFRGVMTPLEMAAALTEARDTESVLQILIERLPEALRSDWCVVIRDGDPQVSVLSASIGSPSLAGVSAPWLPCERAIRLPPAGWMPASWTEGPAARGGQGKFELAAAPIFDSSTAVMLGRQGLQYRNSELVEFGLLTRIAGNLAAAGDLVSSVGSGWPDRDCR